MHQRKVKKWNEDVFKWNEIENAKISGMPLKQWLGGNLQPILRKKFSNQ